MVQVKQRPANMVHGAGQAASGVCVEADRNSSTSPLHESSTATQECAFTAAPYGPHTSPQTERQTLRENNSGEWGGLPTGRKLCFWHPLPYRSATITSGKCR